jgi:hypothetical protein
VRRFNGTVQEDLSENHVFENLSENHTVLRGVFKPEGT